MLRAGYFMAIFHRKPSRWIVLGWRLYVGAWSMMAAVVFGALMYAVCVSSHVDQGVAAYLSGLSTGLMAGIYLVLICKGSFEDHEYMKDVQIATETA